MNPFNLFDICFLDINKEIFLEEGFVSGDNKEIITLLKYKEEKYQKTFHLGDIFYDRKTDNYYVFSFLKDERLLNSNGVSGFGFYSFKSSSNNGDFNLYYMKDFINKFNENSFNNELKFIGNAFFKKNILKEDSYYHHNSNIKALNSFYIYLKKDDVMRYFELKLTANIEFFVVRKIIDVKYFYFYIKVYQVNCFNRESMDSYQFVNGSLHLLNDYAKDTHETNKDLFSKELHMNPDESYELKPGLYENILNYYDKLFIYLDKNGCVTYKSMNENNKQARKSKNAIYIKSYLFNSILPTPFSVDKDREIYLNNLLEFIS